MIPLKKLLPAVLIFVLGVMFFFSPMPSNAASKTVRLNKSNATLTEGKTLQLKVINYSKKVKWSSSKEKIVSVSSKGKVKAKKAGTAKVYAKISGKKLACIIKVKKSADKEVVSPTPTPAVSTKIYTFRQPAYLTEHYQKHGIEMGFTSEEDYLAAANAVISHPKALHKLEAEDNDHIYFIEATNEIVFLSQDGYIRTYFICSGKQYFDKQ